MSKVCPTCKQRIFQPQEFDWIHLFTFAESLVKRIDKKVTAAELVYILSVEKLSMIDMSKLSDVAYATVIRFRHLSQQTRIRKARAYLADKEED